MVKSVDILIVGAGPAGSAAARAAAEAGVDVLMIEKRRHIGAPVQCAEYVPRLLTQKKKIFPDAIVQKTQNMLTFMPNGEVISKSAPGFILDREKFDRAMAMEASDAGATILTKTKAVAKKGNRVMIQGPSGGDEIEASVVIGADGPDSVVGSWVGQKNRKVMSALQHTVVLKQSTQDTEVHFSKKYPGGYAWLFPKGDFANVGVGVQKELGGRVKPALHAFKAKIKDRIGERIGTAAGRIPVGGPLRSIDERARIILAGDAAGHTHAITGGGIPQAVICGAMAGRAAAAGVNGDAEAFEKYYHQWRSTFGPMMDRAADKREQIEAGWHGTNLTALLKKTWVTCEEYYHDA